jgi:hypothetical protein
LATAGIAIGRRSYAAWSIHAGGRVAARHARPLLPPSDPFFEQFERRQIKVVLLDDMEREGDAFFRDLFDFLGVDDSFRIDTVDRYNGSGVARNAVVERLLPGTAMLKEVARALLPARAFRRHARLQHGVRAANLRRDSELLADLRRQLTERYDRDDIRALEKLIGRDLGHWLS